MSGQRLFKRFWLDEAGATAIEYALLVGIMTICIIGIASVGGSLTSNTYAHVAELIGALGGS